MPRAKRARVTPAQSQLSRTLTPELVDFCAQFVFGPLPELTEHLRNQEKEKAICAEIADGIRRLGKRGYNGLAEFTNTLVVGTVCKNRRQACAELRMNLLEDPYAPFETKVHEDMEFALQYRTRWRRFCAWTKGGPEVERYPMHLLVRGLMDGRL